VCDALKFSPAIAAVENSYDGLLLEVAAIEQDIDGVNDVTNRSPVTIQLQM
jgi:hypothetical protein